MVRKEGVRPRPAKTLGSLRQSAEITRSLREFKARYADSAMPLEEMQRRLREELGEVSLSEELARMRDE